MELAREYIQRYIDLGREDALSLYRVFFLHEYANDRENALFYLERALQKGQNLFGLEGRPWLEDIQLDPEYQAMVNRYQ